MTHSTTRLRALIIKGATGSFALQTGFACLAFINAIILARVLGSQGYGAFANAMAWVSLLTIPATCGFGILLVRCIAIYRSRYKWALISGLLRFSGGLVLLVSVALGLVFAVVASLVFSDPTQEMMRSTVWIALLILPFLTLLNLTESAARGFEHVVCARFPGMIVRPALLLVCIGWAYFFFPQQLTPSMAMMFNVGASVVALGLGVYLLKLILPEEVRCASPKYIPSNWLKTSFPMLMYGGSQIILGQTDIVMLGAIRGAEETGQYAAASRLAYLLAYVTFAIDIIMAPIIARLYANEEKKRLQSILAKAVRVAFVIVLPGAFSIIYYSEDILNFFGQDFLGAKIALVILVIGRLADVALGSAALVLTMAGYERIVAIAFAILALVNVILNGLFIPEYGIEGAAIASVISLVAVKLFLSSYIRSNTGLCVTVIGTKM